MPIIQYITFKAPTPNSRPAYTLHFIRGTYYTLYVGSISLALGTYYTLYLGTISLALLTVTTYFSLHNSYLHISMDTRTLCIYIGL